MVWSPVRLAEGALRTPFMEAPNCKGVADAAPQPPKQEMVANRMVRSSALLPHCAGMELQWIFCGHPQGLTLGHTSRT